MHKLSRNTIVVITVTALKDHATFTRNSQSISIALLLQRIYRCKEMRVFCAVRGREQNGGELRAGEGTQTSYGDGDLLAARPLTQDYFSQNIR